MQIIIKLHWL